MDHTYKSKPVREENTTRASEIRKNPILASIATWKSNYYAYTVLALKPRDDIYLHQQKGNTGGSGKANALKFPLLWCPMDVLVLGYSSHFRFKGQEL